MKTYYFNNAATSYPKAPGVAECMMDYIKNIGSNINRGTNEASFETENVVYETRELIAHLFHFDKPENVIFTKNITESLNVIIKGLLRKGDHVIVSSMEHNAVMRPLNAIGADITKVQCNKFGEIAPVDVEKAIRKDTKAIIMLHASNVCGTILDMESIGKIAKSHGVDFIIDSAQTAGFTDINFNKLNASAIAFTGHKSLLGPQGIGGFIVNNDLAKRMNTLIEGGTGSNSENEIQPEFMPDKFESGTMNIPGIFGLNSALKYIKETSIKEIHQREIIVLEHFLNGLTDIKGIELIGKQGVEDRTAAVSIDFIDQDNGEISDQLSNKYGIMTRCGLHCAPSAHKTLGTFPRGTVRFSLSQFTTNEEVEYVLDVIKKMCDE